MQIKKNIFLAIAVVCTMALAAACSKDDDYSDRFLPLNKSSITLSENSLDTIYARNGASLRAFALTLRLSSQSGEIDVRGGKNGATSILSATGEKLGEVAWKSGNIAEAVVYGRVRIVRESDRRYVVTGLAKLPKGESMLLYIVNSKYAPTSISIK